MSDFNPIKAEFKVGQYSAAFTQWEPSPPWVLIDFRNGGNAFTVQLRPEEMRHFIKSLSIFLPLIKEEVQDA